MKYYTQDNTHGFDQAQLNKFNDEFPNWAQKNEFDIEDQDLIKNATDAYYNGVMI
jgi:hypothetical protein